jgi:cytochrome c-type biogenesis protein CcmH
MIAFAAARHAGWAKTAAIVVALALPLAAIALYAILRTPAAISPPSAKAPVDAAHGVQSAQALAMVEPLAAKLRANPEDVNGWTTMARSLGALGRFEESAKAYAEVVKRSSPDASLLADYADVLAMSQGRRFDGEPDRLVARALEIDRSNIKALALAGTSAFGRKDYAGAVAFWSRIREQISANSPMARELDANLRQARALASAN